MKHLVRLVSALLCCLFVSAQPAAAISRPVMVAYCQRTHQAPVIDGKLDDPCWQACQPLGEYVLDKVDELAPQQTVARVCYDERFLYFAFDCRENDMANTRVERTGWTLPWYEDSVEIFLDAGYDQKNYAQFGANLLGACNIHAPKDAPELRMAAGSRAEDGYFIEVRISWSELKVPAPPEGQTWGMNLTRNRYREDGKLNSSWGRLKGSFHKPVDFGQIIFAAPPQVPVRSVLMGWENAGLNAAAVTLENTASQPQEVWVGIEGTEGANATIPAGQTQTVRCLMTLEPGLSRPTVVVTSGERSAPVYQQQIPVVAMDAPAGWAAAEGVGVFRIAADKPVCYQGDVLSVRAESATAQGSEVTMQLTARFAGQEQQAADRLELAIPEGPDGQVDLTLEAFAGERCLLSVKRAIPVRGNARAGYTRRIDAAAVRVEKLAPTGDEVEPSRVKVEDLRGFLEGMTDRDVQLIEINLPELEYTLGMLQRGATPVWGVRNRGYTSQIDGSEQHYVVAVPPSYTEDADAKFPVMIFLHGYINDNPWKPEGLRHNWQMACWKRGVIAVAPFGRGSQGYRDDGEQDVMDVLDEVRRLYRVDEDRIYLGGFSMGGGGTMHLGTSRPDQWAAVVPCSAWPRTDDQLGNLRHVPTWMFCGGQETCVPLMQKATQALQQMGGEARFTSDPASGHTTDYIDFDALVAWLLEHRLVRAPKEFRFVAPDPSHTKAYWATIDGLLEYGKPASVAVRTVGKHLDVTTSNVATLELRPPAEVLDATEPITLTLNGQRQAGFSRLGRSGVLRIHCGGPSAASEPAKGADKPSGPVKDVFAYPFLIVYGTGEQAEANRAAAEGFAKGWNAWHHGSAAVKADAAVTAEEVRSHGLVVIGLPDRKTPVGASLASLPVAIRDRGVQIGDHKLAGESLGVAVLGVNPQAPSRYVLFVGGQDEAGVKLAAGKLPGVRADYFVVRQGADDKAEIVARGHFAGDWRTAQPASANSQDDH